MEWAETVKTDLQKARRPLEGLWRDIRLNFEPTLGRALDENRNLDEDAAKRDDEKIINSKPRDVVGRLASGLQSGITNQARQWFRLVQVGAPSDTHLDSKTRRALDEATEVLQGTIASSNIYTALISMYMRIGQFGTACALLLPDEDSVVRLDVLDEGAYWVAQDRRGRVCTLLRRAEWTVRQLVDEFGDAVPESVRRDFEEGRAGEYRRCWNLVLPTIEVPRNQRRAFGEFPFASLYWIEAEASNTMLAQRGYLYNPIIAPRWSQPTDSTYGLGLGQMALGDAKELQTLELSKLKVVAAEADPPMAAPESMRTTGGVNLNPGAVNYFSAGLGGQSAGHIPIQPIDQRPKRLDEIEATIATQEQRLGRLFYEDLFAMLLQIQMGAGKRQMTATEVTELASEKIALLGPILTRLNHDMLDPLVGGVYTLCHMDAVQRLDEIAGTEIIGYGWGGQEVSKAAERYRKLLEVDNLDITVEYQSTLHAEQQSSTRMMGVLHTLEFAGLVSQYDQQAIDNLDTDEAIRIAARSYMEFGIIRDQKDVDTIREGRAQMAQQQMEAQQQQMKLAQAESQARIQAQQAKMMKDIQDAQAASGANAFQEPGLGGGLAA